jgi:hypothetical protein
MSVTPLPAYGCLAITVSTFSATPYLPLFVDAASAHTVVLCGRSTFAPHPACSMAWRKKENVRGMGWGCAWRRQRSGAFTGGSGGAHGAATPGVKAACTEGLCTHLPLPYHYPMLHRAACPMWRRVASACKAACVGLYMSCYQLSTFLPSSLPFSITCLLYSLLCY